VCTNFLLTCIVCVTQLTCSPTGYASHYHITKPLTPELNSSQQPCNTRILIPCSMYDKG
jgi:hypothetical protein